MVKAQPFPWPQRVRHRELDMTQHIHQIYYQYSSHVANKNRISITETTRCTMSNIRIDLITPNCYKQTLQGNIKKIPKSRVTVCELW